MKCWRRSGGSGGGENGRRRLPMRVFERSVDVGIRGSIMIEVSFDVDAEILFDHDRREFRRRRGGNLRS